MCGVFQKFRSSLLPKAEISLQRKVIKRKEKRTVKK
jgi:hypothetical protein